jgi:hypothetical protein
MRLENLYVQMDVSMYYEKLEKLYLQLDLDIYYR